MFGCLKRLGGCFPGCGLVSEPHRCYPSWAALEVTTGDHPDQVHPDFTDRCFTLGFCIHISSCVSCLGNPVPGLPEVLNCCFSIHSGIPLLKTVPLSHFLCPSHETVVTAKLDCPTLPSPFNLCFKSSFHSLWPSVMPCWIISFHMSFSL